LLRKPQKMQEVHDSLAEENAKLSKAIDKLKIERENLKIVYEAGGITLEKMRLVRITIWWYLLLLANVFFVMAAFSKTNYTTFALSWLAFLLTWRGLYVPRNGWCMGFSLVIVVALVLLL
jgi:hypothetical protein